MLVVTGVSMAAVVLLACRLPGDTEPGSDFWPPDALIDGIVDERREFRLCPVPRMPGVLDLVKHMECRQAGKPLCRYRAFGWCLLRLPPRLRALHPRTRAALRLAHGLQDVAEL
jgi:hypothetical protein